MFTIQMGLARVVLSRFQRDLLNYSFNLDIFFPSSAKGKCSALVMKKLPDHRNGWWTCEGVNWVWRSRTTNGARYWVRSSIVNVDANSINHLLVS